MAKHSTAATSGDGTVPRHAILLSSQYNETIANFLLATYSTDSLKACTRLWIFSNLLSVRSFTAVLWCIPGDLVVVPSVPRLWHTYMAGQIARWDYPWGNWHQQSFPGLYLAVNLAHCLWGGQYRRLPGFEGEEGWFSMKVLLHHCVFKQSLPTCSASPGSQNAVHSCHIPFLLPPGMPPVTGAAMEMQHSVNLLTLHCLGTPFI